MQVVDKILKDCGAKWSLVKMLSTEKDKERINQTGKRKIAVVRIMT